ncbi:hypothetical protein DEM26_18240 [Thioclava sp. NG1]|uniref:hypothetical protein n=1 Tax=Thioclava sp. NG1 TaxID=2182426 RepID=UPI000D616410|nr:hypothetical protein [Thioclava sp. NG1]PWE48488.1 hypothetical protein DEM26_18240 [Thioclava sp. NG1]
MPDWSSVIGWLLLAEIDTPDGPARFWPGTDGVFTDTNGDRWVGSVLLSMPRLQASIGGTAPAGEVTLAYFQDPDSDDLIGQVKALGIEYVEGREIKFYAQPLYTVDDLEAPQEAPVLFMTRTMEKLDYTLKGAADRSITLSFESSFQDRKSARRHILDRRGHSRLLGYDNPSLEFMPTSNYQDEPLFGG